MCIRDRPEPPKAQPAIALVPEPIVGERTGTLQVSAAVRDLRHVRNLSQRQLAGRMGVPRTYISKIENGKAMPTLSSLCLLYTSPYFNAKSVSPLSASSPL